MLRPRVVLQHQEHHPWTRACKNLSTRYSCCKVDILEGAAEAQVAAYVKSMGISFEEMLRQNFTFYSRFADWMKYARFQTLDQNAPQKPHKGRASRYTAERE